jgi:argininosuccinate synthase
MKVVVAYSGGLDTSIILKWVKETYDADVVAFCADVGQEEELDGLEEKALSTGASKCYIEDLRREFARDFIFPMFQANAVYEGTYLLGTSIARPLIGKYLVEIAKKEGADAICHGATGKGNDQVRFELTAYALNPEIKVISPWREWSFKSRGDLLEYAESRGIPVPVTAAKPYSMDRNMLHISFEGGILEDPWAAPPEDLGVMTRPLDKTPDQPETLEIAFVDGIPARINGEDLPPEGIMKRLNEIAGRHGVGRVDMVENRFVGMKSRGVYETPGGTVLQAAHRAIESITMDREVMRIRDSLIPEYARMVYNGFWYAPERKMLQAAITESQRNVTGDVRLKLFKGACHVEGRRSPFSLYDPEIATFEEDDVYDQKDAGGFIKLNALRLRVYAAKRGDLT